MNLEESKRIDSPFHA